VRNLVLLLVLINLGVLAWFNWVVPEPEQATSYSGPGITLLRELDPDAPILAASRPQDSQRAAAPGLAAEDPGFAALTSSADGAAPAADPGTEPVPPPADCVAIGPFADAAQADAALATVNDAGFQAALRVEQEEIWEGYWVYVGGLPSTERANAVLAELAANGIADAYVIPNSDSGILISLGVFSDITRAGTQAQRAGRFGLAATITERTRTVETRWLELRLSGEDAQALDLLQEPGRISRLEQRACRTADPV
jgi:cell division septation protein DedD